MRAEFLSRHRMESRVRWIVAGCFFTLIMGGLMLLPAAGSAATTYAAVGGTGAQPFLVALPQSGRQKTAAAAGDASLELRPQGDAPAGGATVSVGRRFVLELWLDAGTHTDIVGQQSYLTFTQSLLQNAAVSTIGASCDESSTVTADLTVLDTQLQNRVCNSASPCPVGNSSVPAGSIAYASGALNNPPAGGTFRVAQIGLCAVATGQATLHWQFSPPDPANRNTKITDESGGQVQDPALFADYVINIVDEPTVTPTASVTATETATATATETTTATATPSQTPSATSTATQTASPSPTATDTATATATPTNTGTPTPSYTPMPTSTPTDTATATATQTDSPTATETASVTVTPTETGSITATSTASVTVTATGPTITPTQTASSTPTESATGTITPTGTATLTSTVTVTLTPDDTHTVTATRTRTSTVTPSASATVTATETIEPTVTGTVSATYTSTSTPTPTHTWTPTWTATATTTATTTATLTSSTTRTITPTVTVTTTPCAISFSDVRQADYFYEPVLYLACNGVISGYSDGTFKPFNDTTRGQLAKIVSGAEGWPIVTQGGPHFSDVPATHPFYGFIETAFSHGVISGYSDGTFRPFNNVTRGQLSKIVVKARGWTLTSPTTPTFIDVGSGNPFYLEIETAVARGIISGYDTPGGREFRWGNNATRGQISKIVYLAVIGGVLQE